jgi:hypothetical protein
MHRDMEMLLGKVNLHAALPVARCSQPVRAVIRTLARTRVKSARSAALFMLRNERIASLLLIRPEYQPTPRKYRGHGLVAPCHEEGMHQSGALRQRELQPRHGIGPAKCDVACHRIEYKSCGLYPSTFFRPNWPFYSPCWGLLVVARIQSLSYRDPLNRRLQSFNDSQ